VRRRAYKKGKTKFDGNRVMMPRRELAKFRKREVNPVHVT